MNQNYLVTGGLGFIGSNLVDSLVDKKNNVFVIDDLSSGTKDNINSKATYLYKDISTYISSPQELINFLEDNRIDVVFHLAANASVNLSFHDPERVYEINLTSSITLANCCEKANVKKILFASTSAVYGEPDYLPVDESHETRPISPYGLTKLSFEQYLRYFTSQHDLRAVVYRLANVYGKRQRSDLEGGVISIFNNLILNNKPVTFFGDGSQTRDWVHVDDIVSAFCAGAEDLSLEGNMCLGSGVQTSLSKLFTLISGIFPSYTLEPIYQDPRIGEIKHMVMQNKSAKAILNWSPKIDLEDGLRKL